MNWSGASLNRKTLNAALAVGSLGMVASLALIVRDLAIAYRFGTGDNIEAFLVAYLLPLIAMQVIAGSFSLALIPEYIRVRQKEGLAAANSLFSASAFMALIFLALICVALAVSVHYWLPLLTYGFPPQKRALTETLFLLLTPSLVLSGIASLWSAVLNANGRFVSGALIPCAVPLGAIIGMFLLPQGYGIYALAIGTLVGYALQCILLMPNLRKLGVPIIPRYRARDSSTSIIFRQCFAGASGSLLMASTTIVDQAMAAILGGGSVAALSYGSKLTSLVLGIGATALGTALLPHLSILAASQDWSGMRRTLLVFGRATLLLSVPVVAALFLLSEPMVRLLFQRGTFTAQDTTLVASVQAMGVLQIPFYLLGTSIVRALSALQLNRILFIGTLISVIANITLNLLFMRWLGIAGIALSTSVVYLLACIFLGYCLYRSLESRSVNMQPNLYS